MHEYPSKNRLLLKEQFTSDVACFTPLDTNCVDYIIADNYISFYLEPTG